MFKILRPVCIDLSNLTFNDTIIENDALWNKLNQLVLILKDIDRGKYTSITKNNNIAGSQVITEKSKPFNDSQIAKLDPKLAEYIFIPITKLLKFKKLTNKTVNYILSIIYYLLKLSWCDNLTLDENFATQLFPIIDFLTGTNINLETDTNVVEDTKINQEISIDVISQFVNSLSNQQYGPNFFEGNDRLLHHLTNIVTKLLNYLSHDEKLDLGYQLLIIDTLQTIYNNLLSFDYGETISYILPGNISVLTKLLSLKGLSINYKIVSKLLSLFGTLLKITYNDIYLEVILIDGDEGIKLPHINKNLTHRKDNWLLATREQIKLAMNNFLPNLVKRSNLHDCTGQFIQSVINYCENSLSNLVPILVQNLILMKQNPSLILTTNKNLMKFVQIEFTDYVTEISNFIQWNKIDRLERLNFICELIKPNNLQIMKLLKNVMLAVHERQTVIKGISNSNYDKILIQSSNVIVSDFSSVFNKNFKKQNFLQNIDQDLELELSKLIYKLNNFTDLDTIYNIVINDDSVIDKIWSDQNHPTNLKTVSQQQTLILWTISSFLPNDNQITNNPINAVIDEFLDITDNEIDQSTKYNDIVMICLEYINSIMENTLSLNASDQVINREQEILICTMLWSLNKIISVMDKDFSNELIDYFYFIVENLASSSMQIRELSQICMTKLANVLYDGSLQSLIIDNVDYLIESISQRLNLGITDKVTTVLMVICKMTSYQVMLSFQDILETIFQMLDFYHGYKDMVLQFFQFFEIISNEMGKLYLDGNLDNVKLSDSHLNRSGFTPWGNQNMEQLIKMLDEEFTNADMVLDDDDDKELAIDEPKNFQEYFDQKLKIHEVEDDSDDEDDDSNAEGNEGDDGGRDEIEWVSPIPVLSYRLLIKILNYGDRLLTTEFKPLKIQILKNISLIIPMLSTQYDSLLPQVAQIWGSVVQCMFDTDYSIVIFASHALQTIIKCSKTFICKRFIELWCELQENCALLRELRVPVGSAWPSNGQMVKHVPYPPITKNALVALSEMLLEGLQLTENMLDETVMVEMVSCCLQVLPREVLSQRSLVLGDIVWLCCR